MVMLKGERFCPTSGLSDETARVEMMTNSFLKSLELKPE